MAYVVLAGLSLVAWIYLVFFRGWFWRMTPRLEGTADLEPMEQWPRVAVIIPARNESSILANTLPTVLATEYPGEMRVILVDDDSSDGTAEVAQRIGRRSVSDRLAVVRTPERRRGWQGKLWAMQQGIEATTDFRPTFALFLDADISIAPDVLTSLVSKAVTGKLSVVSVMACLRLDSVWDRLLIPAFVYFFAKLYPFRWSNNPRRRTAAAAGGCSLVRLDYLKAAGGLQKIASAVIDDCALASLIKRAGGKLWLGFCDRVRSVREYRTLKSSWDMVARSAYAQLRYSPALLAGTVLGMVLVYLIPGITLIGGLLLPGGSPVAAPLVFLASCTLFLMLISYSPVVQAYGVGAQYLLALPLSATLYTLMTVSSAWRVWRGHATPWKGRDTSSI